MHGSSTVGTAVLRTQHAIQNTDTREQRCTHWDLAGQREAGAGTLLFVVVVVVCSSSSADGAAARHFALPPFVWRLSRRLR